MSNMISKTNIEWVKNLDGSQGYVFNAVWGCRTGCEYCYARNIAKRFCDTMAAKECKFLGIDSKVSTENFIIENIDYGSAMFHFFPTWLESNFQRKFPKKPSRIFVNSMSDIRWWSFSWMQRVIDRIESHPEHTFIFLTKFPEVYKGRLFPKNCWLGVTVENDKNLELKQDDIINNNHQCLKFVSFEPLQSEINTLKIVAFDWVIVGAETGNRKEKVAPKEEWIKSIYGYCLRNQIPLFIKDNVYKHFSILQKTQEFPKEI